MGKKFFLPCAVVFILIGLMFTIPAPEADAAGTVGTGTPGSCTETAFDTALLGGGAVNFNCGGTATITFTSTKTITIATTISGGDVITLSGGNTVRLFNVTGGGLTLNNITLVNGRDSLANFGAAAIFSTANVTITASTISGHQSTYGPCSAIIMNSATLYITRSTITGNVNGTAANIGQAICSTGSAATLNIDNTTITGNTGGAIYNFGTATLVHCTIAGNSPTGGNTSGIVNSGSSASTTLIRTIVSNNTGGSQCSNVGGGSVSDGGGNLQFPAATCGGTITVADPLLGPLANNGGPTQTMSLPSNSPAVDSITEASGFTIDQRNLPRPIDIPNIGNEGTSTADIGAFELQDEIRTAIPTMTEWGMIIFVLLAGLGAVYFIRRQKRVES